MNWVKWGILKLFQKRNQKVLKSRGIKAPVFFGMFYTCEMKREVVEALLPAYRRHARKRGEELELMFHPGTSRRHMNFWMGGVNSLRTFICPTTGIMRQNV